MLFCCSIAFAQNIKRPDTYNYNRGVEAIQKNNAEEALEYLNKNWKTILTTDMRWLGLQLCANIKKSMVVR